MDEKDDTRSLPWDFSPENCMSNGGKNTSVRAGQKSWPIFGVAGFVLWQSVHGRALFGGTEPLARVRHCGPALMEKGHFLGLIFKRCLQGFWISYLGESNASVFKLCHWSQVHKCVLQCTKTRVTGTVTNGDKLLCNKGIWTGFEFGIKMKSASQGNSSKTYY